MRKIGRLVIMDGFVSDGDFLEVSTLFIGKPVKIDSSTSDVIRAFKVGDDCIWGR